MGLSTGEVKRKRHFKTVIIPKGIIDPNEDNVIEIPIGLYDTNNLIVKAPSEENSCFSVEPFHGYMPELKFTPPTRRDLSSTQTFRNTGDQTERDTFGCSSYQPRNYSNQLTRSHPSFQHQAIQCEPSVPHYYQTRTPSPLMEQSQVHSPVCPICSRASCKYFSGPNHTFTSHTQFPSFHQPSVTAANFYSHLPTLESTRRIEDAMLSRMEEEMLSKIEDEMLTRIIDDKVDRILKPLLYSMTKSRIDDEETEMSDRSLVSGCSGQSCSSVPSKPSKEKFYSKKYDFDEYRTQSLSHENSSKRRSTSLDYDNFKRGMRRNESGFMENSGRSSRISPSKYTSSEYDLTQRQSSNLERDNNSSGCSGKEPCQKRTITFSEKPDASYFSRDNESHLNDRTSTILEARNTSHMSEANPNFDSRSSGNNQENQHNSTGRSTYRD